MGIWSKIIGRTPADKRLPLRVESRNARREGPLPVALSPLTNAEREKKQRPSVVCADKIPSDMMASFVEAETALRDKIEGWIVEGQGIFHDRCKVEMTKEIELLAEQLKRATGSPSGSFHTLKGTVSRWADLVRVSKVEAMRGTSRLPSH